MYIFGGEEEYFGLNRMLLFSNKQIAKNNATKKL